MLFIKIKQKTITIGILLSYIKIFLGYKQRNGFAGIYFKHNFYLVKKKESILVKYAERFQ